MKYPKLSACYQVSCLGTEPGMSVKLPFRVWGRIEQSQPALFTPPVAPRLLGTCKNDTAIKAEKERLSFLWKVMYFS